MERVCLRCGKKLSAVPILIENPRIISFGKCLNCARDESYKDPPDFLDTIKIPALSISGDFTVSSANLAAASLFQIPKSAMIGMKHGNLIKCPNSENNNSCGETSGCLGCEIYRAVNKTITTGIGVTCLEAYKDTLGARTRNSIKYEISTAKVGDRILLFIEPIRAVSEGN